MLVLVSIGVQGLAGRGEEVLGAGELRRRREDRDLQRAAGGRTFVERFDAVKSGFG